MVDKGRSLLEQIDNIINNESHNTFWRKKTVIVRILIIASCLVLVCIISYIILSSSPSNSPKVDYRKLDSDSTSTEIYVDLSGAVNKPGVYNLKPNTRLFMLIEKAGGFNMEADREFVARNYNLSVPLSDQQKIYIPTIYDVQTELVTENQKIVSTELDQISNTNTVAYKKDMQNVDPLANLISINKDDVTSLMILPGVGEVTAQRIIASRPYETIDSLVNKGVIKQTLFEKIKNQIIP